MQRRTFLQAVGGAVGSGALSADLVAAPPAVVEPQTSALPRRKLGRTDAQVSIIGYPGLALIQGNQDECTQSLHHAFERGVNYFDVAPAYGNGDAEVKMGIGLQGLDRSQIFLACKTKERKAEGARQELERSLARLKTDRFDLYQLHALIKPEEVQEALAPGGAIETLVKAREEGLVRYLGFSAHTTKAALAALEGFRFDTVMFPINFVELFTLGFGKAVLERATADGAAVLAIKPMSRGLWPKDVERTRRWWYRPVEDDKEIDLALRFTLSQPGVVAGFPPAWLDLAAKAFEAGRAFHPVTGAETEELRKLAATCESVFRREEQSVARRDGQHIFYADSPHECCGGEMV